MARSTAPPDLRPSGKSPEIGAFQAEISDALRYEGWLIAKALCAIAIAASALLAHIFLFS
jgi:hypothetical protein